MSSIRQLFAGIRGARTACRATLTCTVLCVREREATEASEKEEDKVASTKQDDTEKEESPEKSSRIEKEVNKTEEKEETSAIENQTEKLQQVKTVEGN